MKALVTGATGFIGSHIADLLHKKGYDVVCTVRSSSNMRWLKNKPYSLAETSLSDKQGLIKALDGVDIVFHVAGLTTAKNEAEFMKGNRDGTRTMLDAVLHAAPNITRFVHVSSLAAVGPAESLESPVTESTPFHPLTAYGRSKKAAEDEVMKEQSRLPITIIRPPAVYGQRDTEILTFFRAVKSGIAPLIGFDEKRVSLIHGLDLSRGIIEAGESPNTVGKPYFISSKKYYTWEEIGKTTQAAFGKKSIVFVRIPHPVVFALAGTAGFLNRFSSKPGVLNYEKGIDITRQFWICSIENAERDFHFKEEISLQQGIQQTIEWYKQQGWL